MSERSEPGLGIDLLTEVLRQGARELLTQAVEQEVQEWHSERSGLRDEHDRKLVVRNGHLPERTILTGIGPVAVRHRESEELWKDVLRDLKRRGLVIAPNLAVGDGALGFWAALRKEWPAEHARTTLLDS